MENRKNTDIAVIGVSCRFPGNSDTIDLFWKNLLEGKELISRLDEHELNRLGVKKDLMKHPNYVNSSGFLHNIDKFDHEFFRVSPLEAAAMDPQQRLFLEEAYHALEDSGYVSKAYDGKMGVFAGSGTPYYFYDLIRTGYFEKYPESKKLLHHLGNEKDFLALKAAYFFNCKGPTLSLNLGCATGLAVIVKACEELSNNNADIMIAGASSLIMPNQFGYIYEPENILSMDGYCKPFDSESAGTVLSAGVGVVVLKRLQDAINDNDVIHGVIKGYAMTNDGHDKIGFTAPSIKGQAACIENAFGMANIDFNKLKYIEAHGTGTALGDPIEVAALSEGIKKWVNKPNYCALGTVKANMGHAQSAAGMAGFIKLMLTIKNKKIPPLIHFKKANPKLNIDKSPFYFNTDILDWNDDIRIGGVNSLGMGGVNCHVVIQNYDQDQCQKEATRFYEFKRNSHWVGDEKIPSEAHFPEKTSNVQAIAEKLVHIWKKILNLDEIFFDDDFESLGGSSLQAINIVSEIEKNLNVRISLDDFLKHSQLRALLNYLVSLNNFHCSKEKIEILSKIKKNRNIFIVHPGNGELYNYNKLAQLLNEEFNLIGIHNSVFNDLLHDNSTHVSISSLADRYIQLIKAIQPCGPYILCGWSFGGVVAFEMAEKLMQNNQSVDHVFLIDSWMKYSSQLHDPEYFYHVYLKKNMGIWEKLLWRRMEALFSYQPNVLNVPITLFKASKINDEYMDVNTFDNHWGIYCKKNIKTVIVEGNHETILTSPGVENLARSIIQTL